MTNPGAWPPPPPPPPPPHVPVHDQQRPSRSRLVVGIAVAVAFALVAAVVAALVTKNDDATVATSNADPPGVTSPDAGQGTAPPDDPTEPPATTEDPGPTDPTGFDAQIDQIAAFVADARGLSFTSRPVVVALSDADFVARYRALNAENQAEYADEYAAATVTFSALGLLVPGLTYVETSNAFGDAGVVGFYNPETDELAVRGSDLTPFVRTVVAHELVHAIDDQNFDLDRPEYDDAKDEIGFGLSAVAEGNARRIENLYVESLSADDQRSAQLEELTFAGDFPIQMFEQAFLKLQLAPYTLGEQFVSDLIAAGDREALDEAFVNPPNTSEQIIDFDAYLDGESYVEVDPPAAGGEVVDDGLVGQLVLQYILETAVPANQARQAADGWAGDAYVAWQDGDVYCLAMAVEMDTENDAAESHAALDRWVRSRPSGATETSGNQVSMQTCTE